VEKKKASADAVIINGAGFEELQRQIDRLLENWHLLRD
jgi:dephospho-CoA kinase